MYLFEHHPNTSFVYLPKVHAKVYISNRSSAIVASANFTEGGQTKNFEYGVKISDPKIVQRIYNDIDAYKNLGAVVTPTQLKEIQVQVKTIKKAIQTEQTTLTQKVQLVSCELQKELEDNLIRVRVKQKSVNAIFSDTLLYLLSQKPLSTEEMHTLIKDIHPDLCDDTLDRIIDGKHFGKLWKHQVRNAQVTLKKTGQVFYDKEARLWYKAK